MNAIGIALQIELPRGSAPAMLLLPDPNTSGGSHATASACPRTQQSLYIDPYHQTVSHRFQVITFLLLHILAPAWKIERNQTASREISEANMLVKVNLSAS